MPKLLFTSLVLSSLIFTACTQNPATIQVSSTEFNQLISTAEGILLDVRTQREFQNGHIEHAGQLNFYALDFRTRLLLLPKDKPVYLYCNTGYRSDKAADFLIKNGYTQVYNLQHGIMEGGKSQCRCQQTADAQFGIDVRTTPGTIPART